MLNVKMQLFHPPLYRPARNTCINQHGLPGVPDIITVAIASGIDRGDK